MSGSNLAKSALINFGLLQLSAIPRMKPLGTSYLEWTVYFVPRNRDFPGKRL